MTIPTFFVQWVDPNDTTLGMDFFPPKGSDELHEALKQYYPHLGNLQSRMRQAVFDFLLDDNQLNSAQVSPASDKPTPDYLPSPMSSFPSSAIASPPEAFPAQSAPQNSTSHPKQEDLMTVWTLPSNPDARIHKRRTMTVEEKRAYKLKRLEGACADCKRRRRKCQHGTVASPAASSSSSSKPARRKIRQAKSDLEVPAFANEAPPNVLFNAISMDQCLLPAPQAIADPFAFNLETLVPSDLPAVDQVEVSMPEMDFAAYLDNDFIDLTKDWQLFPDANYDLGANPRYDLSPSYAPLQSPHVVDSRQCLSGDGNVVRNSDLYCSSPGGFETWSPSLGIPTPSTDTDQSFSPSGSSGAWASRTSSASMSTSVSTRASALIRSSPSATMIPSPSTCSTPGRIGALHQINDLVSEVIREESMQRNVKSRHVGEDDQRHLDSQHSSEDNLLRHIQKQLTRSDNLQRHLPFAPIQSPIRAVGRANQHADHSLFKPGRHSPSSVPFSSDTSTRAPPKHGLAVQFVRGAGSASASPANAVGGADRSLFKPGHHSFYESPTSAGVRPGGSIGWRTSTGSHHTGQVQMCVAVVYIAALWRATVREKSVNGVFFGSLQLMLLLFLWTYGGLQSTNFGFGLL